MASSKRHVACSTHAFVGQKQTARYKSMEGSIGSADISYLKRSYTLQGFAQAKKRSYTRTRIMSQFRLYHVSYIGTLTTAAPSKTTAAIVDVTHSGWRRRNYQLNYDILLWCGILFEAYGEGRPALTNGIHNSWRGRAADLPGSNVWCTYSRRPFSHVRTLVQTPLAQNYDRIS